MKPRNNDKNVTNNQFKLIKKGTNNIEIDIKIPRNLITKFK